MGLNAQSNRILWKALSASIAIQESYGDWEKIKQAVDFAFYFSDHVSYTEHGYGIIIYEMINALEVLHQDLGKQAVLQIAYYIYEEGQKALECFDDDWDWTCALEALKVWVKHKE